MTGTVPARQPLHARIRSDFEAQILYGSLAPGERLPTEQELMAHYACSRMTVSKALSALAAAGLVARRKRAGTIVARPRLHSMVLDIPDLGAQVAASGRSYGFRLVARRVRRASADDAGRLAPGTRLLDLGLVHRADSAPFALEQRLINLSAVPTAETADFAAEAPGGWLLAHVPWTEAETRILAAGATEAEARTLGLAPGAPCLVVERRTWRQHDTITHVRQLFRADSYDMVARFGPS